MLSMRVPETKTDARFRKAFCTTVHVSKSGGVIMKADEKARIRNLPFFATLPTDAVEAMLAGAMLQHFPAGTVLFRQNDPPDFLYVLLEGLVGLTGGDAGQETVVEFLRPVEAFVVAAAVTDANYLVGARVIDRARVLLLPAETVRTRFADSGPLATTLMSALARHYRMLVRQIKDLKLRTSTERLGCYLLELAGAGSDGISVALPVDKRLIAARLGMTPENLSRAFSNLRRVGVRTSGPQVTIADMAALRLLCRPDPDFAD